jgi:hypothetical protein
MEQQLLSRTCDSCGFVEIDYGRAGGRVFANWWTMHTPGPDYGNLTLHACSNDCAKLLADMHGRQWRSQRRDQGTVQAAHKEDS